MATVENLNWAATRASLQLMTKLIDICTYPVKGLNGISLPDVELKPGAALPLDRAYAIARGSAMASAAVNALAAGLAEERQ